MFKKKLSKPLDYKSPKSSRFSVTWLSDSDSIEQRSGDSGEDLGVLGKKAFGRERRERHPGPHHSLVLQHVFLPLCCSPFFHMEHSNTAQFSSGKINTFPKYMNLI